jgi:hypothetical protein
MSAHFTYLYVIIACVIIWIRWLDHPTNSSLSRNNSEFFFHIGFHKILRLNSENKCRGTAYIILFHPRLKHLDSFDYYLKVIDDFILEYLRYCRTISWVRLLPNDNINPDTLIKNHRFAKRTAIAARTMSRLSQFLILLCSLARSLVR